MREILRVQKLGKNHGGYHGETIDIRAVLGDIRTAARLHGWSDEVFGRVDDLELFALHRPPPAPPNPQPPVRIYLSAGIHGDEPAGPLAVLRLIRENRWPAGAEMFLVPCLNPVGFTLNRRENVAGVDLNRDYRQPRSPEVTAHRLWLERQPGFTVYFCLHEDWESHGFYLYEQNPDEQLSVAEVMVEAVRKVCPIDLADTIEGRPAQRGIIRPNLRPHERPDWPEAFYLITEKARQGYTLEAPSDFPLATRVAALVAAVNAALPEFLPR